MIKVGKPSKNLTFIFLIEWRNLVQECLNFKLCDFLHLQEQRLQGSILLKKNILALK